MGQGRRSEYRRGGQAAYRTGDDRDGDFHLNHADAYRNKCADISAASAYGYPLADGEYDGPANAHSADAGAVCYGSPGYAHPTGYIGSSHRDADSDYGAAYPYPDCNQGNLPIIRLPLLSPLPPFSPLKMGREGG